MLVLNKNFSNVKNNKNINPQPTQSTANSTLKDNENKDTVSFGRCMAHLNEHLKYPLMLLGIGVAAQGASGVRIRDLPPANQQQVALPPELMQEADDALAEADQILRNLGNLGQN